MTLLVSICPDYWTYEREAIHVTDKIMRWKAYQRGSSADRSGGRKSMAMPETNPIDFIEI